jgi:hypothetical protein
MVLDRGDLVVGHGRHLPVEVAADAELADRVGEDPPGALGEDEQWDVTVAGSPCRADGGLRAHDPDWQVAVGCRRTRHPVLEGAMSRALSHSPPQRAHVGELR